MVTATSQEEAVPDVASKEAMFESVEAMVVIHQMNQELNEHEPKPQLFIITDWFEVDLRTLVLVYALIHVASG